MGGKTLYARCPESPTKMSDKGQSCPWKLFALALACAVLLVLLVLLVIFAGLYTALRLECKSYPLNHTASAEHRVTESEEQVKEERNLLQTQLAAVNQSLTDTRTSWANCKEELEFSKNESFKLEDNLKKKEEDFKHLDDENKQLKAELAELKSALEACKKDRDSKDAEIRQMKARETSSGVDLFGESISSFLLLPVLPLLCSLL